MLTDEQKRKIAEELLGSCRLPMDLEDEYNCDDLEIAEAASEYGVELCTVCGWWTDLWNEEEGDIVCISCNFVEPDRAYYD